MHSPVLQVSYHFQLRPSSVLASDVGKNKPHYSNIDSFWVRDILSHNEVHILNWRDCCLGASAFSISYTYGLYPCKSVLSESLLCCNALCFSRSHHHSLGPPGKPACVNSLNTFGNHGCFAASSFRMGKFCGTGAATSPWLVCSTGHLSPPWGSTSLWLVKP